MRIEFSRRSFLGGMTALFASASADSYAEAVGAGRPHLRFGVLSDTHIAPRADAEKYLLGDRRFFRPRSTELLEKALRRFDEMGADAVTIAGDITDWGTVSQFKAVVDCWNRVFPGGRSSRDGREVTFVPVMGNHDVAFRAWTRHPANYITKAFGPAEFPDAEVFKNDIPGNWRRVFGEPYEPVLCKTVKGYTFLGGHWHVDHYSDMAVPDLPATLKKLDATLRGNRPFFYIQHPQPRGTCLETVGAPDDGTSTRALSAYPNAVAFSGHSHLSLTDGRNVWQGAFTSIGAASLDSLGADRGRENGSRAGHWNHRYGMKPQHGRDYGTEETFAAHGMFVNVYDGFLEIETLEFVRGIPLGPTQVVHVPAGAGSPFFYERRKALASVPPPFPEGSAVSVSRLKGLWRLEFPAVRAVAGVPEPQDYEVTAFVSEDDAERRLFRRYVLRPDFFLPLSCRSGTVVADFKSELIPEEGDVRFEIRARDVFGRLGGALTARLPTAARKVRQTIAVSTGGKTCTKTSIRRQKRKLRRT